MSSVLRYLGRVRAGRQRTRPKAAKKDAPIHGLRGRHIEAPPPRRIRRIRLPETQPDSKDLAATLHHLMYAFLRAN